MITSRILTGGDVGQALDALARLRIEVFRHWPYLYDGDFAYERDYLERYCLPGSVVVAAYDGNEMIGASTGALMEDHAQEFGAAFRNWPIEKGQARESQADNKLENIFYMAESVLLPAWRGRGLGHVFFDGREAHARKMGRKFCAFCSVVRPADHPLRPADYQPLDGFWRKRGYAPLAGIIASFPWKDVGEEEPSLKKMQFWIRKL